MVELLAPAGNFISLTSALKNGADAVYIGLEDMNMRVNASNFSLEDIKKASQLTREYGAKLYVCTNTIMKDKDIEMLKEQLPYIKEYGADGIILSDISLIDLAVENGLEAHMSVQENTTNFYALKALEKLGVKRAILSRELSLDEIKDMGGLCKKIASGEITEDTLQKASKGELTPEELETVAGGNDSNGGSKSGSASKSSSSSNSTANSPKTGVAGAGTAMAVLALAGIGAFLARSRKDDDQ